MVPALIHRTRKYLAHPTPLQAGNRSILIFLTVCTKEHKAVLANQMAHDLLLESWTKADSWLVGRYCVMPDHVHLFCAPNDVEPGSLKKWVGFWRGHVARRWVTPADGKLWQTDFWDTQLRMGERYSEKWEYVRNNPVRKGLVRAANDWPYQGEMNTLVWHDK